MDWLLAITHEGGLVGLLAAVTFFAFALLWMNADKGCWVSWFWGGLAVVVAVAYHVLVFRKIEGEF